MTALAVVQEVADLGLHPYPGQLEEEGCDVLDGLGESRHPGVGPLHLHHHLVAAGDEAGRAPHTGGAGVLLQPPLRALAPEVLLLGVGGPPGAVDDVDTLQHVTTVYDGGTGCNMLLLRSYEVLSHLNNVSW